MNTFIRAEYMRLRAKGWTIRRWRGAGYGETRNFHVKELEKRS